MIFDKFYFVELIEFDENYGKTRVFTQRNVPDFCVEHLLLILRNTTVGLTKTRNDLNILLFMAFFEPFDSETKLVK